MASSFSEENETMSASRGNAKPATRRYRHLFAYGLFRVGEGLLGYLSLSACSRLGEMLGFIIYHMLPGYRRLAMRNLRIAYGKEGDEQMLREICRRHFRRLGSNLVVSVRATSMSGEVLERHMEVEGMENLDAALAKKRGAVMALGHLGPWELLTQSVLIYPSGQKRGALYQALSNPYIDRRVRALRKRFGQELFDRQDGFFPIMRHLRAGGMLGVLVDQHAGDHGVYTPFFGRLASTSTLPVLLARRTGAPLVVLTIREVSHARWRVCYSKPLEFGEEAAEADWLAAMHGELEGAIMRSPEDWFWVHNRWKTPNPHFLLSDHHRGIALPSREGELKPFRMVVRSPNWLGDACMAVPAVRAMKRGRPDVHLTVLSPANVASVWRQVEEVDVVFERGRGESVFSVAGQLRRAGPFDVGILLPNSSRTALEMWLAGIPRIVGYAGSWRRWLIDQVVPEKVHVGPPSHHVEHYLQIVHRIGGDCSARDLFLPIGVRKVEAGGVGGEVCIGICAGAEYGPAKRWPMERFAAVAGQVGERLRDGRKVRWVLFGSPGEVGLGEALAKEMPDNCRNLVGKTSMEELMVALRGCDLLISNDTGTMHLAALLGVSTVAIFGSTEPRWTRPLGKQHTILREHVECSPCFLRECPLDFRCMKAIEPEMVVRAVNAMVDSGVVDAHLVEKD